MCVYEREYMHRVKILKASKYYIQVVDSSKYFVNHLSLSPACTFFSGYL